MTVGIERLVLIGSGILLVLALVRGQAVSTTVNTESNPLLHAIPQPLGTSDEVLTAARSAVVSSDPFRITRRPPAVAFRPGAMESEMEVEAPRLPYPTLALAGILGGPPWQAVVRGFPGRSGNIVVKEGESVDEVLFKKVTKDSVVVESADTSWVLTMRLPWN